MKSIILIIALSLVVASEAKGDIKSINKDNVIKPEIVIPVEELKNCFPYVNNYGFYEPWQKCESQCCGGCLKRYCCNNPEEIILYQEKCENNEFIQSGNYPQKNPVCYSFIDRYDNIISEEKCEDSKFCSGTCSNRYCGQSEQHWLDQDKCQNNIGVKTTQVDTLPTEVETTPQSTDRPRFPTTTYSIEPLFRINYYAILTMLVIFILFIMVITLLFKLNRMDQLLRRYRQQEQLTLRIRFDDDVPPPYTGVKY